MGRNDGDDPPEGPSLARNLRERLPCDLQWIARRVEDRFPSLQDSVERGLHGPAASGQCRRGGSEIVAAEPSMHAHEMLIASADSMFNNREQPSACVHVAVHSAQTEVAPLLVTLCSLKTQ